MLLVPLIGVVNYLFGLIGLKTIGREKIFMRGALIASIMNIFMILIAGLLSSPIIMTFAFSISEMVVLLITFYFILKIIKN